MRNKQLAGIILTVAIMAPSFTLAATLPRKAEKVAAGPNFCTNLNTYASQISERVSKNTASLETRQGKNRTQLQERQAKRAADLINTRAAGDADRQEVYSKLTAKASTDAQKQAVVQFKNTVEAAIAARRSSVDAALKEYWDGMTAAMGSRQTGIDAARQSYSAAVKSAITTAQNSCAAAADAAMVKAQFAKDIAAARTKFESDRQAIDKYGPQVKALVQTRNATIKKAFDDFQVIMEQARAALKSSLNS